jgi:hypothetical protein
MALLNYRPTKRGFNVYVLVGKRFRLVRRFKPAVIDAVADLPADVLATLALEYGIRPPSPLHGSPDCAPGIEVLP